VTKSEKLIIIGSGPAGYTAAIYAARAGLTPLLISGPEPGGQLMITQDVENFPGFTSVEGPKLMATMKEHAQIMGTRFAEDTVVSVDFKTQGGLHRLTGQKQTYESQAIILATGATARWLGLESETKFRGFGVSACATCDGPFFKNKVVAVVGGGNTAAEEALFLTNHATKVYLIHRRDALRAEHVLQQRLFNHPKIEIIWNHVVSDIQGQDKPFKAITALDLQSTVNDAHQTLPVQGLFIAIGHVPNTKFLGNALKLDSEGYIIGTEPGMTTEVPGIFTAGDVRDKVYRQAITAAGQGCMAALDAEKYLSALT
jgi:thioredoxin reductase (NADPH)